VTQAARFGARTALALVLAMAGANASHAMATSPEFAVKAAYLHKLAAFVAWPESAFESSTSPIQFCVAGASPFGSMLQQAVADQRIGSHPILIRNLDRADRVGGCHVLYLAAPNAAFVAEALRGAQATPVLTVTDSAFEHRPTGIIHFVLRDARVRFEIDEAAAARNGLTLSSKLLGLALTTRARS
jgi:hypothetical protein